MKKKKSVYFLAILKHSHIGRLHFNDGNLVLKPLQAFDQDAVVGRRVEL